MTGNPLRSADLHVHTSFSSFRRLKPLRARDSCDDPRRVCERCREIGGRMGLARFGVGGSDAHGLRPIATFVALERRPLRLSDRR